ncbi:MAG: hypothetical protein K2Y18_06065 [Alphaproteobacteria bacterium]|jgi:DnaA regulatory inactivator Hda|nr:hypothetical protein [Alphaproteobacteria bacterium]
MTRAHQLLLDLPVKASYAEADYVESPCNWEASQFIRKWPDWTMQMGAIYGEPGCGKTHLAHIWQSKSGARYLNTGDINTTLTPHDAVKEASAIVLDDIDSLFDKAGPNTGAVEDWMFHFYNLAKERDIALLFCCRQPPTQWDIRLPDLRSRLATILSVPIHPPDEDALQAVLFKLISQSGMTLSIEVGDYILRRVERSFEGVRTLVETLNEHTLSQHRQLTLSLVREVLSGADNK